jgi:hypothetical protein
MERLPLLQELELVLNFDNWKGKYKYFYSPTPCWTELLLAVCRHLHRFTVRHTRGRILCHASIPYHRRDKQNGHKERARTRTGAGGSSIIRAELRGMPGFLVGGVGLTPTDVQRNETESQPRSISHPDRRRQPIDGCEPLSCCAYTKGGKRLGAQKTKFAVT